jgi:hypothetical protein
MLVEHRRWFDDVIVDTRYHHVFHIHGFASFSLRPRSPEPDRINKAGSVIRQANDAGTNSELRALIHQVRLADSQTNSYILI